MNRENIIRALEGMKVETGSLICLGCAYEDHCSTRGCAVMREAARTLKQMTEWRWISVEERLPDGDELVLAVVSGWPVKNVELRDAYELARYTPAEGWILEMWPEWEGAEVSYWTPLPEPPEDVRP